MVFSLLWLELLEPELEKADQESEMSVYVELDRSGRQLGTQWWRQKKGLG